MPAARRPGDDHRHDRAPLQRAPGREHRGRQRLGHRRGTRARRPLRDAGVRGVQAACLQGMRRRAPATARALKPSARELRAGSTSSAARSTKVRRISRTTRFARGASEPRCDRAGLEQAPGRSRAPRRCARRGHRSLQTVCGKNAPPSALRNSMARALRPCASFAARSRSSCAPAAWSRTAGLFEAVPLHGTALA